MAALCRAVCLCSFKPERHVLLQEELKHLYTGITRAKSNVSTLGVYVREAD